MPASRRIALIAALLLIASACGDDDEGSIVPPPPTDAPTTSATSAVTTTSVAPEETPGGDLPDPDDPLLAAIGQLFDDPFDDSITRFYEMRWADEQNILVSEEPIEATGHLAIGHLLPPPVAIGLPEGALLVEAWADFYEGDLVPNGTVLYVQDLDGWQATVAITSWAMETALEATTDYPPVAPDGPVAVQTTVSTFDWPGRVFTASVAVYDYFDGFTVAYEGELECQIADPFVCVTLSDDGVLRPGDEGDAVEALQNDLVALGYLSGPVDGKYGPGTSAAVSALQADYWLAVDGKAGPNTLEVISDLVAGTSELIMASKDGIGSTLFGTPSEDAYAVLFNTFGPPDDNTGWYVDACDGHDWLKATWQGFTAIFTDRDGFRQLDGWEVIDLSDLPSNIRIDGGVRPDWTWEDFADAGALFDPTYGGFFRMPDEEYNNGRFVDPPTDPPAAGASVRGFGTGTGAFVSC